MRIRSTLAGLTLALASSGVMANDWLNAATQVAGAVAANNPKVQEAQQQVNTAQQTIAEVGSLAALAQSDMNLTADQTVGGLGALFSLAQATLPPEQFSQMSGQVPQMPALLAAASALSGGGTQGGGGNLTGAVLGMASQLGGQAGQAGQVASALATLNQLGFTSDQIGNLVNVVMGYFQGQPDGAANAQLFQTAMGALLSAL